LISKYFKKLKNFSTFGLSNFLGSSIFALFWFYLASSVEKTEYGEIGYLMSIAYVAIAFSTLGLERTIIVYGAKDENIFSPTYSLGLVSAGITAIVAYVIIQNVFVSLFIIGMMIFYLYQANFTREKRYIDFSKYKILRASLSVILAIIFYHFIGINGILIGYALGTIPAIPGLYKFLKNRKIKFTILKSKLHFIINNWLTGLFTHLLLWGDKIIIGSIFGFTVLGSFHLASQYFMLLNTFPYAVFLYLLPQESQGIKNTKIKFLSIGLAGFFFPNINSSSSIFGE